MMGVVAALERIDTEYGDALPADRRTELRQVIARIQARYFGPGATDIDEELDQVVRNWAREATSRA